MKKKPTKTTKTNAELSKVLRENLPLFSLLVYKAISNWKMCKEAELRREYY